MFTINERRIRNICPLGCLKGLELENCIRVQNGAVVIKR